MRAGHDTKLEQILRVVIDYELAATLQAFLGQFKTERGGVLLGHRSDCQTVVGAAIFPTQLVSSEISCSFDISVIDIVHEALGPIVESYQHSYSRSVVGWVHSHPSLGVFLSPQDRGTLRSWTDLDNDAVAVVVDPYSRQGSVGAWGQHGQRCPITFPPGTSHSLDLRDGVLLAQELRARRRQRPRTFWDIVCSDGVVAVQPLPCEVEGDESIKPMQE